MNARVITLVSLLALTCAITVHAQKPANAAADVITYNSVFKSLIGLAPDPKMIAPVAGMMIQRDVGTFMLDKGTLYFCKPVVGRVCAVIFEGEGSFNYMPPTEVERMQLQRVLDKQTLDERFTTAVFFFADSTLEEMRPGLTFATRDISSSVTKTIENALEYVSDRKYGYFDQSIVRALMNNDRNDLFYSMFYSDRANPLFFRIDPYQDSYQDEEVQLLKRGDGTTFTRAVDVINSFHRQDYYVSEQYDPGVREGIDITHYQIDATIGSGMDFSATTRLEFTTLASDLRWINLTLTPGLEISSMTWEDGSPAAYEQTGVGILWVRCKSPMTPGQKGELTMTYAGKVIERQVDWFFLLDPHYWYPHHVGTEKATFDLTFHTPKTYQFASIGEKVSSEEKDGVITSRWAIRRPVRNASFNIGICKEHTITRDTLPPITVYMSEGNHSEIADAMIEQGLTSGSDMEKQVGEDVENSCMLFQAIFGRPLATSLYATEIPYSHGEAFPGLVHLWWKTFQRNDESGFDHFFRAHEVAHQWWGIGVDFKTYHDQWLSEGFATYAGLLYLQAVKKKNDKFFNMLDEYRKAIIGNRSSIFGKGREAGPIWLGYRTSTSNTPGDYDLIVYKKGAWVLHMLRNMLLDMQTMKEEKFFAILRDFYTTYKGSDASTEDFRKVVEKHVGIDMGWFFREWVYGTAVPSYKFAYKVGEPVDGKYKVTCRVEQLNVPEDFQMYVPIKIDFGDDKIARLRVQIQGKGAEFELPPMPMKPKEVVFNDLNSVLCEVDNVSW